MRWWPRRTTIATAAWRRSTCYRGRAGRSMRGWAIAISVAVLVAASAPPAHGDDDESELLVAEGRTALRKGDTARAARVLDRALALNPRRLEAYVLRAGVHTARKEYTQGVAVMRRARALEPDHREVLT